jgi:SulP family sulfate permease
LPASGAHPALAPRTPPELVRQISNGIVVSALSLALSLSYAALVFSGPLAPELAYGVGFALIGAIVLALLVSWKSSLPFSIAGPDGNISGVLAAIVASMVATMPAEMPTRAMAVNALYLLVLSGLLTGMLLFLLGTARLGRWIRFVPYPVTGGFIAGVGWLLLTGGFQIITNQPVQLATLYRLLEPDAAPLALAGVAFALLLTASVRRWRHFMVMPALLLLGTLGALAAVPLLGGTLAGARSAGWFFSLPAQTPLWTPWSFADLALLDTRFVLMHLDGLLSVALVAALSILMNATSLEMESSRDADLDHELQVQGGANMVAAALGGLSGYTSLSRTLLNHRLGSQTRAAGVISALVLLAFMLAGMSLIAFVPKPVIGGLILFIGAGMLWQWLVALRPRISRADHLTIVFIAVVVTVSGFVTGVLVGVVAGCIIFAVNYSRISILKHRLDGTLYSSSRVRSGQQTAMLRAHGAEIQILVLQGFIFFGTADRLYRLVVEQASSAGIRARALILDFQFVNGLDSSALTSFRKICSLARAQGTTVWVSGARSSVAREFSGTQHAEFIGVLSTATLDEALERCETELLQRHAGASEDGAQDLLGWLGREFGSADLAAQLQGYLRRREVATGEFLCKEGQPADSMYFIEQGSYAVEQAGLGGSVMRLRTLGHNTLFGEMGLYRVMPRSASVRAQEPGVVFELSRDALARMRLQAPALADTLSAYLIKVLSDRLAFSNVLCMTLQS